MEILPINGRIMSRRYGMTIGMYVQFCERYASRVTSDTVGSYIFILYISLQEDERIIEKL